jgi:hypothetical protein
LIQLRPVCHIALIVTHGACKVKLIRYPSRGIILYPPAASRPESLAGFQYKNECLKLLSGQDQRTDPSFDIAFIFSAKITQLTLVDISLLC